MLSFSTKRIQLHNGDWKRIVCQNDNGPCPLLAIVNALILQNRLDLPGNSDEVDSSTLQTILVGFILDRPSHDLNTQHLVDETIQLIQQGRLVEGLDVNPMFCGSYEASAELAVFDLCGVRLLHGWIVDPQDENLFALLGSTSYNAATLAVVAGMDMQLPIVHSLRSSLSSSVQRQLPSGSLGAPQDRTTDATSQSQNAYASTGSSDGINTFPNLGAGPLEAEGRGEPFPAPSAPPPDAPQDAANTDIDAVAHVMRNLLDDIDAQEAATLNPESTLAPHDSPQQNPEHSSQAPSAPNSRQESSQPAQPRHTQAQLHQIASFLHDTSSQLTIPGLFSLAENLPAGELAVFFRNNHFNTLYKHSNGKLYLLVTDQGYQREGRVVWELLNNERGDTVLVSGSFESYEDQAKRQRLEDEEIMHQIYMSEQIAAREAGALADQGGQVPAAHVVSGATRGPPAPVTLSDYELALKIQQQEDNRACSNTHQVPLNPSGRPSQAPPSSTPPGFVPVDPIGRPFGPFMPAGGTVGGIAVDSRLGQQHRRGRSGKSESSNCAVM